MPCRRHTSGVFAPASACRKIPIICSSLNRLPFICPSPFSDGLYLQTVGREGGTPLPTPRPPGCVMSTVRERARVIDEAYGPGFHYRTPLLPPRGIPGAYTHPGPYPVISPRTRQFVCSLSRKAC